MPELKLEKNTTVYDLILTDEGDFKEDESFDTVIEVSLFTDARASASEISQPQYRRGFWGDEVFNDNRKTGSKLWVLSQARRTEENLVKAVDYVLQSLSWLKEDGYLKDIKAEAIYTGSGTLRIDLYLYRFDDKVTHKFYERWEQT